MVSYSAGAMHLPIPDDTDPMALMAQTVRDLAAAVELYEGTLKPLAIVSRSTNQLIPGSAETLVQYTLEEVDTLGGVNLGSNNTRVTIPAGAGGLYAMFARVRWTSGNPTVRSLGVRVNDIRQAASVLGSGSGSGFNQMHSAIAIYPLNAGDYVNATVYQDDAGGANIGATTATTALHVYRL